MFVTKVDHLKGLAMHYCDELMSEKVGRERFFFLVNRIITLTNKKQKKSDDTHT